MSIGRRILTVGSGSALAQIVSAASTPVLTRLFAPEAHAVWAIFLSTTLVFSGAATLRYELAVVLPRERDDSAGLALAGCISAVLASILAGLAIWAFGKYLFPINLIHMIGIWSWLIPLSVLSTAIYQIATAWCIREANFSNYSAAQVVLPIGIFVCQMLFAVAGETGAWGLIGGTVFGQFGVAAALGAILWRRDATCFSAATWTNILKLAVRFKNYPVYMAPYTIVGLVRERLAYFLLGKVGTAVAAGHYNLVARLANLPNSFVASALRPVFFQYAAGKDPSNLEVPILEIMRLLGLVTVALWAPCVTQMDWLLGMAFGPAWAEAAPYAIALSIPAIPLLMGNWADRMFDVLGRQRAALKMEVVFSICAMGSLLGGYLLFRDLLYAVALQCSIMTLYYAVWLGVLFHVANYSQTNLWRVLLQVGLVGAVGLSICFLAARTLPSSIAFPATLLLSLGAASLLAWRTWSKLRTIIGR